MSGSQMRSCVRQYRLHPRAQQRRYAARLRQLYPTVTQHEALLRYLYLPSTRRQYIIDVSIDSNNGFYYQSEQEWRASRLELARLYDPRARLRGGASLLCGRSISTDTSSCSA